MAIIDPEGLFLGDRMALLSTMARLHWPYMFLLSNAFGRFEISYPKIISRAYSTFSEIPTRDEIHIYVAEYHSAFLLFLYRDSGAVWGQWDTSERYLKSYKDSASLKSPAPNPAELTEWRAQYVTSKAMNVDLSGSAVSLFEKLSKVSKKEPIFSTGKGVGNGVGKGKNIPSTNPVEELSQPLLLNLTQDPQHAESLPDATDRLRRASESVFQQKQPLSPMGMPEPQPQQNEPLPAATVRRRASAARLGSVQEKWFLEEFWPIYWRKTDKAEALKTFKKQAFNETAKDRIIAAVTAQAPEYLSREPAFRPHASTWLNKRRFDDECEEVPKTPVNSIPSVKYETPEEREERISREDATRRPG